MQLLKPTYLPIIISVFLLCGCGKESVVSKINKAMQYEQKNDYKSAILILKNAVVLDPKNSNSRFLLGMAYAKEDRLVESEKELIKSLEYRSNNTKAIAQLAKVKFKLKKFNDVYFLANKDFSSDNTSKIIALYYAGLTAIQINNKKKLISLINQLVKLNPDSPYTRTLKGWTAIKMNDIDDAINIADQTLKSDPAFSPIVLMKARALVLQGSLTKANSLYMKYLKNNKRDINTKLLTFQVNLSLGNNKVAKKIIDEVYKKRRDDPIVNLYKAQSSYEQSDYINAIVYANIALNLLPNNPPAALIAAASYYKQGAYQKTIDLLSPYSDDFHRGPVNVLLLRSKIKLGMVDDVANTLSKSKSPSLDLDLLLKTSQELTRQGEQKRAIKLALKGMKLSPNDSKLLAQIGLAKLSVNDKSGIELLQKSVDLGNDQKGIKLALAMAYLNNGDTVKASSIAKNWKKNKKTKVLGMLLDAAIVEVSGNYVEAKKLLKSILSQHPDNVPALISLAKNILIDGDKKQAIMLYQRAITLSPNNTEALSQLSSLYDRNTLKENIVFLSRLHAKKPNAKILTLSLAQNYYLTDQANKSVNLLYHLTFHNRTPDAYWILLGDSYMQEGFPIKGVNAFKTLVKHNAHNYIGQVRYIRSLQKTGEVHASLEALKNAKAFFKNSDELFYIEAELHINLNQFKKAREVLQKIPKNLHNSGLYLNTLASSYYVEKDYKNAVIIYEKLFKNTENDIIAINLAHSYYELNQFKQASNILESILPKSKDKHRIESLIAEVNQTINPGKAVKYYKTLLVDTPKDYIALNNIANIEMKLKKWDQALIFGKMSYRLSPYISAVLNTYGSALIANDRYSDGISIRV